MPVGITVQAAALIIQSSRMIVAGDLLVPLVHDF